MNNTASDKWLALFLLFCILFIAPWMLGFGGWYDNQPYRDILFYVPFQQQLFIGPVTFFYIQSLLNPGFRFGKKEWLQLLPGFGYLLYCIIVFVTDKWVLHQYYFLQNQADPDFDLWYQLTGFVSMLIYFLLSLRYYNLYRRIIVQVISYAELVMFGWIKKFLLAFLSMLVLRLLFFIAGFIPAFNDLSYTGPWWEFFSFALIFYYIAITGYSNTIVTKVPFKLGLLANKKMLLLAATNSPKQETIYEEAEIMEEEAANGKSAGIADEWKPRIVQLMAAEKLYEDPELSLVQMSKKLGTNPVILSKAINQGFGKNFNDFVNHYRIEAVKQKLQAGEQKLQTLLGIAYDCGFNSKATFNRAFKKATGQSPKEWMEQNITGTAAE